MIAKLADTFSSAADEFVRVCTVIGEDATGPKCAVIDRGVEYVQARLRDSPFCGVVNAKGDQ